VLSFSVRFIISLLPFCFVIYCLSSLFQIGFLLPFSSLSLLFHLLFIFIYIFILVLRLKWSLGAAVKLLLCDRSVMCSSPEKGLLQFPGPGASWSYVHRDAL
jgi:hypothetical protein